jgi:hypothetical protein
MALFCSIWLRGDAPADTHAWCRRLELAASNAPARGEGTGKAGGWVCPMTGYRVGRPAEAEIELAWLESTFTTYDSAQILQVAHVGVLLRAFRSCMLRVACCVLHLDLHHAHRQQRLLCSHRIQGSLHSPVPVQTWQGASPVPVQMWPGASPVLVQMCEASIASCAAAAVQTRAPLRCSSRPTALRSMRNRSKSRPAGRNRRPYRRPRDRGVPPG